MSGKKDSQTISKPAMEFMIGEFLLEMGKVLKHGADKYGDENWKEFPLTSKDYKGARLRHAFKEGNDEDTGLDHLAHEAVNCMFEYWHKYMKYVENPLPAKNEFHNDEPYTHNRLTPEKVHGTGIIDACFCLRKVGVHDKEDCKDSKIFND